MDALQLDVVENYISIDLTISGMLLIDSWCQEAYVSSISTHYFDIVGSISKTIVDPLELPINKYYYINLYNINYYKQISKMG